MLFCVIEILFLDYVVQGTMTECCIFIKLTMKQIWVAQNVDLPLKNILQWL